ncbi:hypothetical protein FE257_001161 [Aspergillus nanangensis]|uniref:Haloacid dehalogenase, type II n=1 Tax=Aspergillus nanangensis TaxID=2582783 RepID=A0AAD4CU51_ASPNN|nr:hypothetical protein FE257_001161 [Aspergillus nanangensis]
MSDRNIVIAFDIYGTLLSFESIAEKLVAFFDEDKSQLIAKLWRQYQLEYTWRLNSMDRYLPFQEVTKNALQHALDTTGSQLKEWQIDDMLTAYESIATFPDVKATLDKVSQIPNASAVIFSNGTLDMLRRAIVRSPTLTHHASTFTETISVDDVKRFKPACEVYKYLAQRVGKSSAEMEDIWLVSSNPFDAVGALNVGLKVIWVDRQKAGWTDRAMPDLRPTVIVNDLEQVAEVIANHTQCTET